MSAFLSAFLTVATHRASAVWGPCPQRLPVWKMGVRWICPNFGSLLDSGCSGCMSFTSCMSLEKSLTLSESQCPLQSRDNE